jgi:hypothetical protein
MLEPISTSPAKIYEFRDDIMNTGNKEMLYHHCFSSLILNTLLTRSKKIRRD